MKRPAGLAVVVDGHAARLAATVAGSGPPVLLLHAGGEHRRVWDPIVCGLADAGYMALAVDQRGHGGSRQHRRFCFEDLVADACQIISDSKRRSVVVGASLGGLVGLVAAARNPTRVAGLMLVDVVPDPDPAIVRAPVAEVGVTAAHSNAVIQADLVDEILGLAPALRGAARRLRVPTMLVRASESPLPQADVAKFLADVPHASVETIHGAGHLVARTRPDELLQVMKNFLEEPPVAHRHTTDDAP